MNCYKCHDINFLRVQSIKNLIKKKEGRHYLSRYVRKNGWDEFSDFWLAYRLCYEYIYEPKNFIENELKQRSLRATMEGLDWADLSLMKNLNELDVAIDLKIGSEIIKNLTKLCEYCAYRMEIVRGSFDTYLTNKLEDCMCGHVIDMEELII